MHPGEERGHSEGHCNVITSLGTKLLGNGPWPSLCVVRFQRRYNKLLCDDQEFAIRTVNREEPSLIRPRTIVLVTEFQPQTARSLSRTRLIRTVRAMEDVIRRKGTLSKGTSTNPGKKKKATISSRISRTIFLCGCCIRFVPLQRNFRGKLHKMCTTLRSPLSCTEGPCPELSAAEWTARWRLDQMKNNTRERTTFVSDWSEGNSCKFGICFALRGCLCASD